MVILSTAVRGAAGGLASAASLAVAASLRAPEGGTILVDGTAESRGRAPTLLASESARALEQRLAPRLADCDWPGSPPRVAARGRLCWVSLPAPADVDECVASVERILRHGGASVPTVVFLPSAAWREGSAGTELTPDGALLRIDLPAERSLAALAVGDLRGLGLPVRVAGQAPGRVATRRALAGLDPGGGAGVRARRWLTGLSGPAGSEAGQAMPLVVGAALLLVVTALILAALGGAVSGVGRLQRVADLAAVSAVRAMRDDVGRLLSPDRLADGRPNPNHIDRDEYLDLARTAAARAVRRNGLAEDRLRVSFPDADSFAPLSARTTISGEIDAGERSSRDLEVEASAEAEAVAPSGFTGAPEMATGGGYSGPLAYRQGKPMRPDVGVAFDEMATAAASEGIGLLINSAFRSDAEQAALFAANPDPTWVAPPGQSLHRCATELDLGPPEAYGWLAANAFRFEFTQRYSWEPWHFGFDGGPAPCSEAGNAVGAGSGSDGLAAGGGGVPSFVPGPYRDAIADSASRWGVSAAVIAAQLMAESNFNPSAVSPVGAQGIAQFMPGTAAMYGLDDPFDPVEAIDAQAHLMSDLLEQFGSVPLALAGYNAGPGAVAACSCVPPYPETQAYVARILSLLDGAGEMLVPELEVRLVQ